MHKLVGQIQSTCTCKLYSWFDTSLRCLHALRTSILCSSSLDLSMSLRHDIKVPKDESLKSLITLIILCSTVQTIALCKFSDLAISQLASSHKDCCAFCECTFNCLWNSLAVYRNLQEMWKIISRSNYFPVKKMKSLTFRFDSRFGLLCRKPSSYSFNFCSKILVSFPHCIISILFH